MKSNYSGKTKIPKKRGECVFCGKPQVTKQHLWPDWIKSVIPREGEKHVQDVTRVNFNEYGEVIIQPKFPQLKRGPIGAKKIRNVCFQCNGGWMSRMEMAAKPTLISLIRNEKTSLISENIRAISSWVVMTSIVAEYTDTPTQSIPGDHRQYLKDNRVPPEGWYIWIGSYAGNLGLRYRHMGMTCVETIPISPVQTAPNVQSSTFVVGSLLLHAVSTTLPQVVPMFSNDIGAGLLQIWPLLPQKIDWPFACSFNDEQVMELSNSLMKQMIN